VRNTAKKIRCIGYKQTFNINRFGLFGKLIKQDTGWVTRGFHYFYIDENDNIEDAYLSRYRTANDYVIVGWGDWYESSDNVNIMMSDGCFSNIKFEIIELDLKTIPSVKTLFKDMDGEQFKEWLKSETR